MDVKVITYTVFGMFADCILLIQYMNIYIKKTKKINIVVAYFLFCLINCILGIMDLSFVIRTIFILLMIMFIGLFFYEETTVYAVAKEAIIFILLLGISELLVIPLIFLLTGEYDAQIFSDPNKPHLWLISLGLSRMIAVLLFKIIRRIQKQYYFILTKDEGVILYLPLLISFIAFLAIAKFVIDIDKFEKENLIVPLSIIAFVLFFSTLLHMLFFERYMCDCDNEKEIKLLKQKNKLQYEYYMKQIETYENIKILYHDLKNHILLMKNNNAYYETIGRKIKEYESFINTGSDVLNVLLWQKSTEAMKNGIEIETIVDEIDLHFIEDVDMCSIIGNLLDNAIESCSVVDPKCVPEINIRIGKVNDFVVFKVENDCVANIIYKSEKSNRFITNKSDKNIHGIGLISVTKAVEKYDGNCQFECSGGKFYSKILIPIPIIR